MPGPYASPGDPTSGFADALASGALAAESGWPVLLTDSEQLSAATQAFLEDNGVTDIVLVGGTAAVDDEVKAALELIAPVRRLAAGDRFGTAVEIAKENDRQTAADLVALTLIEGTTAQSWVGGFAAAAGAAQRDAPIVLAARSVLPPSTGAYMGDVLGPEKVAETDNTVLTCVISFDICEEGRREVGLPPAPLITTDPPQGAYRDPGEVVTVRVDPPDLAAGTLLEFDGCLAGGDGVATNRVELDENGMAEIEVPGYEAYFNDRQCISDLRATFANGETQELLREYLAREEAPLRYYPMQITTFTDGPAGDGLPIPLDVTLILHRPGRGPTQD